MKNEEVTNFLDNLNHPLRNEIEMIRQIILNSNPKLIENIKWNGPNYCDESEDRITMRIQPPKQIQLIFHRGAKVLEQPQSRLINDESKLLAWKANDRAVATFKTLADINSNQSTLREIVNEWVKAASS